MCSIARADLSKCLCCVDSGSRLASRRTGLNKSHDAFNHQLCGGGYGRGEAYAECYAFRLDEQNDHVRREMVPEDLTSGIKRMLPAKVVQGECRRIVPLDFTARQLKH